MKSKAYGYGWILKFVLAALLLGVGIYMAFADEVVYTITGVAIVLFSLLRVIPLMKTLSKEALRTINLIEIIFDTLLGIGIIYVALTRDLSTEPLWSSVYRYALTFVFYVRGLVFFNSVVFLGEKTEVPKFWMHIVSLTIGVIIAVVPNFDYGTVGLFLLIIAILGSIYLGVDGYGGYQKYRDYSKSINATQEKGIESGVTDQLPSNQKKHKKIEEPEDERPYVN